MSILRFIARAHAQQSFNPTRLGLLLNPFYFARRGLRDAILSARPYVHGRVLDVGCGQKPYLSHFDVSEYVGLEIDTPNTRSAGKADAFYDGRSFPFDDSSFDSVVCNQVLEHVFEPRQFLSEVRRVLKADGKVVFTVPFVWDEHEQPYDYARYSSFGVRYLFESNGFEVVESRKTISGVRAVSQVLNTYFVKINPFRTVKRRLVFEVLTSAPINLLGELAAHVLPENADLYLDNLIVASKRP
jgi:SAM-dependent methyltransferase